VCPALHPLVDQKLPVRILSTALHSGKLPNAYLFAGLEGIGKKTAAMAFAMACNCYDLQKFTESAPPKNSPPDKFEQDAIEPCGHCRSCKKILTGNHPDIHIIKSAGEILKIDQIRELAGKLVLKPYEAKIRVVIIFDAHKLNPEAGNSLLKILEEPPEKTIFILTTKQVSDLLTTISSRCQKIPFNPIALQSLQSYIESNFRIPPNEARVIASVAGGSKTHAEMMASSGWSEKRKGIIDVFDTLPSKSINFCLAFAETLTKNKDWLFSAFEIMKSWIRDIAVYHYAPKKIINIDLMDRLQKAAEKSSIESLLIKMEAIDKAEQDIKSNANLRLTIDTLMIKLSEG